MTSRAPDRISLSDALSLEGSGGGKFGSTSTPNADLGNLLKNLDRDMPDIRDRQPTMPHEAFTTHESRGHGPMGPGVVPERYNISQGYDAGNSRPGFGEDEPPQDQQQRPQAVAPPPKQEAPVSNIAMIRKQWLTNMWRFIFYFLTFVVMEYSGMFDGIALKVMQLLSKDIYSISPILSSTVTALLTALIATGVNLVHLLF